MKTYNLYCDESNHLENDHQPYMLLAYISVPFNQVKLHTQKIKEIKLKHHFYGEIKWTKVSKSQQKFYTEIIEYFFSTDISFRALVINKSQIKTADNTQDFDTFYYKMYYQLIHHKLNMENRYNVYLDIKDTLSAQKVNKLKDVLQTQYGIIRNLQNIRSHESVLLQLTDLIMGAINYHLRGNHRVTAKNHIIEKIKSNCGNELDRSTSKSENKFNLFFIELKNAF